MRQHGLLVVSLIVLTTGCSQTSVSDSADAAPTSTVVAAIAPASNPTTTSTTGSGTSAVPEAGEAAERRGESGELLLQWPDDLATGVEPTDADHVWLTPWAGTHDRVLLLDLESGEEWLIDTADIGFVELVSTGAPGRTFAYAFGDLRYLGLAESRAFVPLGPVDPEDTISGSGWAMYSSPDGRPDGLIRLSDGGLLEVPGARWFHSWGREDLDVILARPGSPQERYQVTEAWSLTDGTRVWLSSEPIGPVTSISPDGTRGLTRTAAGDAIVDLSNGQVSPLGIRNSGGVRGFLGDDFALGSSSGLAAAVSLNDGSVHPLDVDQSRELELVANGPSGVTVMLDGGFADDATLMVFDARSPGDALVADLPESAEVRLGEHRPSRSHLTSFLWLHDGPTPGALGLIGIDLEDGTVARFDQPIPHGGFQPSTPRSANVNHRGDIAVVQRGDDGLDRIFVAQLDGTYRQVDGSFESLTAIAWSPDGTAFLVMRGEDQTLLIDASTGELLRSDLPAALDGVWSG